jgi:8-oxo-dGTP pyrophosphatase MutT (NUDIX family)
VSLADRLRGALAPARPDPRLPPGTPAAVMIPLLTGPPATLLFTRRTDLVRDHKGEISFPGGVRHDDDPDLLFTALRETDEELGIAPESFEVLGGLPPTSTVVTGYVIQPFVGLLKERPVMTPSPVEIDEVLELEVVRLAAVEEPVVPGGPRSPWFAYEVDGHTVWGATGRIVNQLLDTLRSTGWTGEED